MMDYDVRKVSRCDFLLICDDVLGYDYVSFSYCFFTSLTLFKSTSSIIFHGNVCIQHSTLYSSWSFMLIYLSKRGWSPTSPTLSITSIAYHIGIHIHKVWMRQEYTFLKSGCFPMEFTCILFVVPSFCKPQYGLLYHHHHNPFRIL